MMIPAADPAGAPIVLIVPGYGDSGPDHWQSLWERAHPAYRRVRQRDWERVRRAEWVAALDAAIARCERPVVLAAHSLGCVTVAHWATDAADGHRSVRGALLVAPPDVERPDFLPEVEGFAPAPLARLPFPSIVVASADDPYASLERAAHFAARWGSRFVNIGPHGHINTAAGFGSWPEGEALLAELCR